MWVSLTATRTPRLMNGMYVLLVFVTRIRSRLLVSVQGGHQCSLSSSDEYESPLRNSSTVQIENATGGIQLPRSRAAREFVWEELDSVALLCTKHPSRSETAEHHLWIFLLSSASRASRSAEEWHTHLGASGTNVGSKFFNCAQQCVSCYSSAKSLQSPQSMAPPCVRAKRLPIKPSRTHRSCTSTVSALTSRTVVQSPSFGAQPSLSEGTNRNYTSNNILACDPRVVVSSKLPDAWSCVCSSSGPACESHGRGEAPACVYRGKHQHEQANGSLTRNAGHVPNADIEAWICCKYDAGCATSMCTLGKKKGRATEDGDGTTHRTTSAQTTEARGEATSRDRDERGATRRVLARNAYGPHGPSISMLGSEVVEATLFRRETDCQKHEKIKKQRKGERQCPDL